MQGFTYRKCAHAYPSSVKPRYCPLRQSWGRRPKPRGQTCPSSPFAPACLHSPPLKTCFLLSLCTKGRATTSLSVTSHPNQRDIKDLSPGWMEFLSLRTQNDQIWLSDMLIWSTGLIPGFVTLLSCWLWDLFSACFTNTNCGVRHARHVCVCERDISKQSGELRTSRLRKSAAAQGGGQQRERDVSSPLTELR